MINQLVIELRGVEFVNKGAQLMLLAILHKVRENYPSAIFVMEKNKRVSEEDLKALGIYKKFYEPENFSWRNLVKYFPKSIIRSRGYVLSKDISVVMDGSGFAFGDQWGVEYANNRLGKKVTTWRREGKKIILLPQAFGPFEKPGIKDVMNTIIENSILVFAREKQSYDYLVGIRSNDARIILSPDFTNLLRGRKPDDFQFGEKMVAIIPNYKMTEKRYSINEYYAFLEHTIIKCKDNALTPFFLIHEGERDYKIADDINRKLVQPIALYNNPDPLIIKYIISKSFFVICSRFHGVVSALSQAIPCLSTSWSHKYEMLMADYEYLDGLLDDLTDLKTVSTKIDYLTDTDNNKIVSQRLLANGKIQKRLAEKMWQKVFAVIG